MPSLFVTTFHRPKIKRRDDARLQCKCEVGPRREVLASSRIEVFLSKVNHMLNRRLKVIATFMCFAKSADQEIDIEVLHPKWHRWPRIIMYEIPS